VAANALASDLVQPQYFSAFRRRLIWRVLMRARATPKGDLAGMVAAPRCGNYETMK
jgi:hypothetical protein